MTSPVSLPALPVTYLLDREHGGIRAVVLLIFFAAGIGTFVITGALIMDSGLDLLSVILGLAAGFGAAWLAERRLKQVWPSGRTLTIAPGGVTLARRGQTEAHMAADNAVTALRWTFRIARRARVPKGWSLMAVALETDERPLIVYTLLSPKQVSAFARYDQFNVLVARKEAAKAAASPLRGYAELRVGGDQRRLREAEMLRWDLGAEMLPDDFAAYYDLLHIHFPDWVRI